MVGKFVPKALKKRNNERFWKEHRKPGLTLPNHKHYFIVRRQTNNVGLCSLVITNVGWIKNAIERGMTPVIDMKNYSNLYLSKSDIGKINAWEIFFEQPCGIGLEDIKCVDTVVYGSGGVLRSDERPTYKHDFFYNTNGELDMWRDFCAKYLHVKKDIVKEAETEYSRLFTPSSRVLGLMLRGTDYSNAHGHPIQPTMEQVFSKIDEMRADNRYDSLLLVTEDKNIRDEMMSRYGADCKCSKQKELEYSGGRLSTYIDKLTTSDRVSMGRDYLKSIIMLTMCDAVICGQTSGSVAMFMLPNKWQDYYVFELGMRQ